MINKIKEYFNGSMEPEPDGENREQPTDLSTAARFFNLLGTMVIAASFVLFPVIGFHITFIFFGILFVGLSILLKSQEQILRKLAGEHDAKGQPEEADVIDETKEY